MDRLVYKMKALYPFINKTRKAIRTPVGKQTNKQTSKLNMKVLVPTRSKLKFIIISVNGIPYAK